jgi:hypothetical protein
MAGLGRKVFEANEVLTAADVNGYLMDQSVMVFDDSTARSSAIGTPTEGMIAYLKNNDAVEKYDGAAWVNVQAAGAPFTSSTAIAYTLSTSDANSFIQFTDAVTVTISTATDFTAGQQVQLFADGTAMSITTDGATFAGAGTSTTTGTVTVGGQYEAVSIFCVDTDTYRVIGNITAVE